MIKRGFLTLTVVLCILYTTILTLTVQNVLPNHDYGQNTNGCYQLDQTKNAIDTDAVLTGSWEFYPDKLLYSYKPSDISGHISARDYRLFLINGADIYSEQQTYSLSPNPAAASVSIPLGMHKSPGFSSASYRLIIDGCRQAGPDPLFLVLPGLTNGNYRIWINGQLKPLRMTTPWGYPIYLLPKDTTQIELVLEVTGTSQILNVCPRLQSVDVAMHYFDISKLILFLMDAILLTSFVILIIMLFTTTLRRHSIYLISGFIFMATFIIGSIWITGFLPSVTSRIPNNVLVQLHYSGFFSGILSLMLVVQRKFLPFQRNPIWITGELMILLALILRMINPHWLFLLHTIDLSGLLAVFAVILCIVETVRNIQRFPRDLRFFSFSMPVILFGAYIWMFSFNTGIHLKLIFVFPVCIIIYGVLMIINIQRYQIWQYNRIQELLTLEKKSKSMQTKILLGQIKPHLIYNTLTSIQGLCYSDPKRASKLIVHFSNYLRGNIDFMDSTELIPLKKELGHIENFIYIQKERFGDAIQYKSEVTYDDFCIPPLTLQPLIENAIKYGIRQTSTGGMVSLKIDRSEDTIRIRIYNDGPGFDPETLTDTHSLHNIRSRLKSLLDAEMTILSQSGVEGTMIEIIIPYIKGDNYHALRNR